MDTVVSEIEKQDSIVMEERDNGYRMSKGELFVRRCFDLVCSLCASVLLFIPMLIISVMIMMKDPGNPFYIHKRVGRNGESIGVLKFRSMKLGADNLEKMLTDEQLKEYKQEYKLKDDPRLIGYKHPGDGEKCFGAVLRRTSIDELPQIVYNILLKGNMSVVGPRPILEDELKEHYTDEQRDMLLSVKPGLTGYWQAYARSNATYETGRRQEMELYYIANRSIFLDLKIIIKTISVVFKREGAV